MACVAFIGRPEYRTASPTNQTARPPCWIWHGWLTCLHWRCRAGYLRHLRRPVTVQRAPLLPMGNKEHNAGPVTAVARYAAGRRNVAELQSCAEWRGFAGRWEIKKPLHGSGWVQRVRLSFSPPGFRHGR